MIKTLGTCKWADIKVGEVFAEYLDYAEILRILIKTKRSLIMGCRIIESSSHIGEGFYTSWEPMKLHKLPAAFQKCFIEWE